MDVYEELAEEFIREQNLSDDEARSVRMMAEEQLTEQEWEIMYGDLMK